MPARDAVHDAVRNALTKDGWPIVSDPYRIQYDAITLFADLAADHVLAAEQNGERIVVEAKSFAGPSNMREFETALGQYLIYRAFLRRTVSGVSLHLAVPRAAYEDFFRRSEIEGVLGDYAVSLLVFNEKTEEIVQWINPRNTGPSSKTP